MEEKKHFSVLRSQAKAMAYNVLNYFLREKTLGRAMIPFEKAQERAAEACGLNKRRMQSIAREGRDSIKLTGSPFFKSPYKHRKPRSKSKAILDEFEKDIFRRTILEFYDNGEFPNTTTILHTLREKDIFHGGRTSLWKCMKEIGFHYKRTVDGKKFLMERNDITAARISFLRKMRDIRRVGGRSIFYLDETFVNQNDSLVAAWAGPNEEGGLKIPVGKGSRLIICHVGSAETGFLKECKLVFWKKGKNNVDYETDMNTEVFMSWFDRFLEALKERDIGNAVIVMDNASYHSTIIDKAPTISTRKSEIQDWLSTKGIAYTNDETRAELLSLVKLAKGSTKEYAIDKKAEAAGHTVIRLPPYHCQYNPIELVWSQVKREIAERNTTFQMKDLESLAHQALDGVSEEAWAVCIRQAEKLQDDDFKKEIARDDIMDPVIVQLKESDSESECSEEDEGKDDEQEDMVLPLDDD